jgi:PIN domain nuclease of toxin-antitoxin system
MLDTHIWVWWVHGDAHLPERYNTYLALHEAQGLGVSVISVWEVAKLVEYGRLILPYPVAEWLERALAYPGMRLLELTPRIIVESTQLPGTFHRDSADQLIVATARVYTCPLVTVDSKILVYSHVQTEP